MSDEIIPKNKALEIRIGNVSLVAKLDAIGAALAAIREAHRDEMSAQCWAAMNRAQEEIAAAILAPKKAALPWTDRILSPTEIATLRKNVLGALRAEMGDQAFAERVFNPTEDAVGGSPEVAN